MARGRFGHRRRPGGSLTSLIHSLYQQQQAEEDRVMFDAYQNGGNGLDGKPVTDGKMRSYIATRRSNYSKDDPLYSEWGNRLIQLDFKIGEDKIGLAYKEGKVGAGAVAAFYREQLQKIPKDSQFYRDVAGRAADWAKAGASAARGAARKRLNDALKSKSEGAQKTFDNYAALTDVLTKAAHRAGLITGNQQLTDADATDLQALLNAGVPGPDGKNITFADWQHATVAAYRAFDTAIAINKQLNRGTKELTKQKGQFLTDNLVKVNAVDDRAQYELARDHFEKSLQDANGDPRAVLAAAQDYANVLTHIKANAEKGTGLTGENDPDFIGSLGNEINALTTGKASGLSVHDLYSGGSNSDLADTADSIAKANEDVKALADGRAFFGQDQYGGQMKVIYTPPTAALDPTGNMGLDKSMQKAIIDIDGVPTTVLLKGLPVQAKGLVNKDGVAVTQVPVNGQLVNVSDLSTAEIANLLAQGYKPTDSKTVGYIFTQSGKTSFGVVQPDGSIAYTTVNPFGGNILVGKDGLGVFVGSALSSDHKTVVPVPPAYNTPDAAGFIADESITPKDLLALAATSDQGTAAVLTAEADRRTKAAKAEADYMARAQGKTPDGQPNGPITSVKGAVTDLLSQVQSVVADLGGPNGNETPKSFAPPSLGSYNQPAVPVVPKVGNATPQTFAPPPSAPALPGKQKDDLALPKPPAPSDANKVGAKAQGGIDDIVIKPPKPPSGGSGSTGKYAL
jgi:hypothetical protein